MNPKIYEKRRKKLSRSISGGIGLLIQSTQKTFSRDLIYPYQASNDFLYFTGIKEDSAALLVDARRPTPRFELFLSGKDPLTARWRAKRLDIAKVKKTTNYDEVWKKELLPKRLKELQRNAEALYFPMGLDPNIDEMITSQFRTQVAPRINIPPLCGEIREHTAMLRIWKGPEEISAIKKAVKATCEGFRDAIARLTPHMTEMQFAAELEASFARAGADGVSFPTIVASGGNATCLHHSPTKLEISQRAMLLVDAGAKFASYAGDITRCFHPGGKPNSTQREVYQAVEDALNHAIYKVRPGTTLAKIHRTCSLRIAENLVSMNLLKGKPKLLLESGKVGDFFMHNTSHWLGLDVHDINPMWKDKTGNRKNGKDLPIKKGAVFTIEPGIYIDESNKNVPSEFRGIGIRLEQDISITSKGVEVLSKKLPTNLDDIHSFMGKSQ